MVERVYRLGFWRDYGFVYVILALMGVCIALFGLYLPFMPLPPQDVDARLGFAVILFTFISLPIILSSWLIFWLLPFVISQRVVFTGDCVIHRRLRLFLPFSSEVRIPFRDVVSVQFGPHMKKKVFPELRLVGFGGLGDGSGFIISYSAGGRVRNESMPIIRTREYYEDVRKIVDLVEAKRSVSI